eukprot:885538-Amphidinium_carterae.1
MQEGMLCTNAVVHNLQKPQRILRRLGLGEQVPQLGDAIHGVVLAPLLVHARQQQWPPPCWTRDA